MSVCFALVFCANSLAFFEPPDCIKLAEFRSKFGHVAVSKCGRFIWDWQQSEDGAVEGELSLLSNNNAIQEVIAINNLKISLPLSAISRFGKRTVVVQPAGDGTISVFESVGNSLSQIASVDAADSIAKVIGFTTNPDEVICALKEKFVLINWRTAEIQVLLGRRAAYSNVFCNGSDRILLFPGATKECGRIETLFRRMSENVVNVTTNVLPGLGGASGSTPAGTAFAQDYATVEIADFENSSGLTAALAAQVSAGPALFLWRGDVLLDMQRMPDLDSCSALRIHGDKLHCVFHFPNSTATHETWSIGPRGLVLLKSVSLGNRCGDVKLNSEGRLVVVDIDGRSARLEVDAEPQKDLKRIATETPPSESEK